MNFMIIDTTEYKEKHGKPPSGKGCWSFISTAPYSHNAVTFKNVTYAKAKKELEKRRGDNFQCKVGA